MVRNILLLVALLFIASGCASRQAPDQLYRELGELDGITRITDGFLFHIGEDQRVVGFFAESNLDRFHEKVIEHICALSGGPCTYTGDNMADVHRGMDISDAQFSAIVENLILAMEDENIPTRTQNRLLAILAPFHGDITGR